MNYFLYTTIKSFKCLQLYFTYEGHAIQNITSLWESLNKDTIGSFFSGFNSTLIISPNADVSKIIDGFIHLMQLQIKFVLFLKIQKQNFQYNKFYFYI